MEFAIAWSVLASIRDPKTAGIVAVLGLIYATVRTIGIGISQSLLNVALVLDREIKDIKYKMGYDREAHSEEDISAIQKLSTKYWINVVSVAAIYLLCLLYALDRLSTS
jgi:predicted RND superfamily exporter protein